MTSEERVLAWVNKTRVDRGKRPIKRLPKGIAGDACQCPIARGLAPLAQSVEVDESGVWLYTYGQAADAETGVETISPPKYVSRFVRDFDFEKFPHLMARR